MSSTDLNLNGIEYQNQLRSKPVRENFTDIQNNFNALRSEVNAGIASTASEVTSARDNYDSLSENINARSGFGPAVNIGGVVSAVSTPDNTILISAGAGICPNGVGVEWSGATTATVSAVTKPRYLVAVVNSDSSLSLEQGATADDPALPALTTTQLPLGIVYQGTASPAVFNETDIQDARGQGATVNNKWFFKIQDAVDSLGDNTGGFIDIGKGAYYEEVDISGKNNINLMYNPEAKHYRVDDSSACVKSVNSAGSEPARQKIYGMRGYGNGKAGSEPILKFNNSTDFTIQNCWTDGNTLCTATEKTISLSGTIARANILDNNFLRPGYKRTTANLFDDLAPYIQNIGNVMLVNGIITQAGPTPDNMHVSQAERTGASEITFYGFSTTQGYGTLTDSQVDGCYLTYRFLGE